MALTHLKSRHLAAWAVGLPHVPKEKPHRSILPGHMAALLNAFIAIQFIVGSYLFFSWMRPWAAYMGDWLFITGSVMTCGVCTCLMIDHLRDMLHAYKEADKAEDDDERNRALQEAEEMWRELMESIFFVVSSIIFMVGCVLFYPELFEDEKHKEWAEEIAAFTFIAGSFGFVVAGYFNALAMVQSATVHETPVVGSYEYWRRKISAGELFLAIMGGVLFVTGSFLYRPSYATNCSKDILHLAFGDDIDKPAQLQSSRAAPSGVIVDNSEPEISDDFRALCVNVMDQGTWLYLVGANFYFLQALLSFWRLHLMELEHRDQEKPAAAHLTMPRSMSRRATLAVI